MPELARGAAVEGCTGVEVEAVLVEEMEEVEEVEEDGGWDKPEGGLVTRGSSSSEELSSDAPKMKDSLGAAHLEVIWRVDGCLPASPWLEVCAGRPSTAAGSSGVAPVAGPLV